MDTAPLQAEQFVTERLQISQSAIAAFCQRWKIAELALFGSVLRDDFRGDSDIDVLFSMMTGAHLTLYNRTTAQKELEGLLGRTVDLAQKEHLTNPFSRQEILKTHRILYPIPVDNFIEIVAADPMTQDSVRNNAALLDMVEAIKRINRFIAGATYSDYLENELLRSGVERQLEILGEAANRLTAGFQAAHPDVDWRNAVGLRNVIIHQYDRINDSEVWRIATEVLPELLTQIEGLLPPLPDQS
jgi:uncharacterized protein with HEPN domain/predicted nucleotidyltransferase